MYKLKEKLSNLKDQILQVTPLEKKVREATTNDSWGPTVTLKRELADSTQDYGQFKEVMGMLWIRMGETGKNYKVVQKSLALLQYLLINGSNHVYNEAKVEVNNIKRLQAFYFTNDNGKEMGETVRKNAKEVCRILRDNEYYKQKRKEGQRVRNRFQGFSKQEMRWKNGSGRSNTASPTNYSDSSDSDSYISPTSPERKTTKRVFKSTRRETSPVSYDDEEYTSPKKLPSKKKTPTHLRRPSFGSSSDDESDDEPPAISFSSKKNRSPSQKKQVRKSNTSSPSVGTPTRVRRASGGKKPITAKKKEPTPTKVEPKKPDVSLLSFFDTPQQKQTSTTSQKGMFFESGNNQTKKKDEFEFDDFDEEEFPAEWTKGGAKPQSKNNIQQQPQPKQQQQPVKKSGGMEMFFDIGKVMTPTDFEMNQQQQQQQPQPKKKPQGEGDELLDFFETTDLGGGSSEGGQGGTRPQQKLTMREIREQQARNRAQRQQNITSFPASFYSLNHPAPYSNVQQQQNAIISPQQPMYSSPQQPQYQSPSQNQQVGGLESFF